MDGVPGFPAARRESFWLDLARDAVEAERKNGVVAAYARHLGDSGIDDLVQETVVTALDYERRNKPIEKPFAFVRAVAFYQARRALQRVSRNEPICCGFDLRDESPAPDEELSVHERSFIVAMAVATLAHETRELVHGHYANE